MNPAAGSDLFVVFSLPPDMVMLEIFNEQLLLAILLSSL